MARKSGPRQLKREPSPAFWPISRKRVAWVQRTRPGPHPRSKSLPLVVVLREILGHARTAREASHIINDGRVKVDGIVRKDHRFGVGLMDVLEIEGTDQIFRILPVRNVGLMPTPINKKESGFKICKIVGMSTISKGRTQLNLHDGRSAVIAAQDPRQKTTTKYSVGSALQIELHQQRIMKQVPFQTGAVGMVVDGKNQGLVGRIESIIPGTHARQRTVRIETTDGVFETPANYVVPIGSDAPLVTSGKE